MGSADKDWELWGQDDPYYGVLADEKFRRHNLSQETLRDFFASGEEHVNRVLGVIWQHLEANFKPTKALDFGCGVGRLAVPLAGLCKTVTGLDVSKPMLVEAEKNCRDKGITNARFLASDDQLSGLDGEYDFIHSFIVFQHIPIRRGEQILEKLLARLTVGGAAVLHFTYDRQASFLRKAVNWVRHNIPLAHPVFNILQDKRLAERPIQMNYYNLGRLINIFHDNNLTSLFLETTNHGGHCGVVFYGLKSTEHAPHV